MTTQTLATTQLKSFLEPYLEGKEFAQRECESTPLSFNQLKEGDAFIVLVDGIASGWGYNEYFGIQTCGVFRKSGEQHLEALCSKYPTRQQKVQEDRLDVPVCIRLIK